MHLCSPSWLSPAVAHRRSHKALETSTAFQLGLFPTKVVIWTRLNVQHLWKYLCLQPKALKRQESCHLTTVHFRKYSGQQEAKMNGKAIASFTISFHCCYCSCPFSDLTFYYLIVFFLLLTLTVSATGSPQQISFCKCRKCRGRREVWGKRASWNFTWNLTGSSGT